MAKRKLKKGVKKVLCLLFLIIICCGGYLFYSNSGKDSKDKGIKIPSFSTTNKSKETWPKSTTISLVATGDAVIHNAVYKDGYNASSDSFDFSSQLSFIKDIIPQYDIAYYNQETVFGGRMTDHFTDSVNNIRGYSGYPTFNSPSEFGDAMVNAGFNVASLASNHSADCLSRTKECINNAYNFWESKNIVFDGFNIKDTKENIHNIGEAKGIKYGFLNYTYNLNGLDGAVRGQEYLIDRWNEEVAKTEIEELRSQVDVLIVSMHWHTGAEFALEPTEDNKKIAEYLSSLGVDIILGTYSHCLQPYDVIGDNKTVVFYSLGNFISNQGDLLSSIGYKGIVGVLATLDITKTEYEDGTSEINIGNVGADLTYTYNKNHKDYRVIPFSKITSDYLANYQTVYEDYKAVLTKYNTNINIKELSN